MEPKVSSTTNRPEGELRNAGNTRAIEYAWLCSTCCRDMAVYIDDGNSIRVTVDHLAEGALPLEAAALDLAERELSSFVSAVTRLYGAVQAGLSAQDWLDEFGLAGSSCCMDRNWRALTIAASARLARRLNIRRSS